MLILLHIGGLVLIGLVAWWLSRYDSKLSDENRTADFVRRGLRCGITLLLVEVLFWLPPAVLCIPIFLAVIWAGCISEVGSRIFHWLIDPEDKRPFDPAKNLRELDAIAALIRNGKKAEAIELCRQLRAAGEVDAIALDLTLEHLGVPRTDAKTWSPLKEAGRLRREGKTNEAGLILHSLLAENPRNLDAGMMLVRLYAEDLRQPDRAHEILHTLEQQPHISADHIEFAYRSIEEWSRPKPAATAAAAPQESIDDLLASGGIGTAIERLEDRIREEPTDFDAWLKLAEVHAWHCHNLPRAVKVVHQIELNPNFTPEQIQMAEARLKVWREPRKRVK